MFSFRPKSIAYLAGNVKAKPARRDTLRAECAAFLLQPVAPQLWFPCSSWTASLRSRRASRVSTAHTHTHASSGSTDRTSEIFPPHARTGLTFLSCWNTCTFSVFWVRVLPAAPQTRTGCQPFHAHGKRRNPAAHWTHGASPHSGSPGLNPYLWLSA